MCGRFTLTNKDFRALAAHLEAAFGDDAPALYRRRYNIAPTDQHWIVRAKFEQRELLPATWGLVNSWSLDAKGAFKQINARSETAPSRPAFREAFEKRRCIVPADGFYEWVGAKEARRPIWFHPPGGGLIYLAGLYETWRDPSIEHADNGRRTFTILTTSANDVVAPVYDRMPVILAPESIDDWLYVPASNGAAYAADLRELLVPSPTSTLVATEVSRRANSVANDDEGCLAPATAEAYEAPRLL